MELELIKQIGVNGSFAILFAWLLVTTMRKNDERELRYQQVIDNLTQKLGVIETATQDIKIIRSDIETLRKSNEK